METRAAARWRHALAASALLRGLLLHPEGRAVWEGRVAPLAGRLGLAAFAAACRAGRDYRRERVQGGEELLRLNEREAYQSPGELRAALSLGGLELNHNTVYDTAQYGTAETLAWLLDRTEAIECYKPYVWYHAARADSGRVAKLELLHERIPGEWDMDACLTAAYHDHMDALVWLHEHGAPWSAGTCYWAARFGHLEALRYAREHGCPWDRHDCLRIARTFDHEHVTAYIEQQPA